jgi:penicillin G amidase
MRFATIGAVTLPGIEHDAPQYMRASRLLRLFNLSIAVLLIALLGAAYWYAWRPLPQTSGQISAPIAAEGRIARDAKGVPHIQAASWEDAIFLQGYAMAQDRLWQMDGLRRRAAGELAEIVGQAALESDREARRMNLRRIAETQQRSLVPQQRAVLAAFARGVNYFIETHRNRLPLEFTLLRYDPRPWTASDCLLAGLEMYRTLNNSWRGELLKQKMLETGERSKVEFLFPVRTGHEPQPGSNAWAVAGSRTASGKPILANDPHLEFSIPSPWYLVHLQAPGLNVTGATIIGLPAVIIGHNDRIAWGATNLQFDAEDLYREPAGAAVQVQQDAIPVKSASAIPIVLGITAQGPLFLSDAGQQYALHWTASEPGGLTFPFLDLDRARNWTEFRAALEGYGGPGQNFVYADTDGNIGYQAAGRLPIRQTCAGAAPVEGAGCDWQGFIPFEKLPSAYNPQSGMIVTANQNPFPADFAYQVDGNFAAPYRANQIRALLGSRQKWQTQEMLSIETDVYSAFDHFLAQQVVAAFDAQKPKPANPQMQEAVEVLRAWKGQMQKGLAAPMIASLVYDQIRRQMAERAATGLGDAYQNFMAPSVVEKLLRERPADWFPDYDALVLRCLTGALDAGQKVQGSKVSRWDYGQYMSLQIVNPVEGRLPMIGRFFDIGPVSMSGAGTTVKQYTRRLGPSLRMVVDLGDLEHSFANLATGESAQVLSPHYKDQWDAYYAGRSFPMQFGKVDAKDVLVVKPEMVRP